MKREDPLLAAILDAPQDDACRLVYADRLEEQGEAERGEFIRVQVELARPGENDSARAALQQREAELLAAHWLLWRKEVPAWASSGVVFRRGFVAEVRCTALAFLQGAGGLFRRAPVERVRLRALEGHLVALAGLPWLSRLRALRLEDTRAGRDVAEVLARSPHLGRLTDLDLTGIYVGPAGARALVAAPFVANLTSLCLMGGYLGLAGTRVLASAPSLAGLTDLNLAGNNLGDEGAAVIATSVHLGRLARLNLHVNGIGPAGRRRWPRPLTWPD
jgi:uncharacterized protein (TIGR02996 family)